MSSRTYARQERNTLGSAGLSNLTRTLRTTRDAILLRIVSDNAQKVDEIVQNYEFQTGEITGHDALAHRLRRMRKDRLIRLASTGRELPGPAEGIHYVITEQGKKVLRAFTEILT